MISGGNLVNDASEQLAALVRLFAALLPFVTYLPS
jgi:hypothetical protein